MKNTEGRKHKKMTIEDLAGKIDGSAVSMAEKFEKRFDELETTIENLAVMTRREFDEQASKLDGFILRTQENFRAVDERLTIMSKDIEILDRNGDSNFNEIQMQFERVNENSLSLNQLSTVYVTRPELERYFQKQ